MRRNGRSWCSGGHSSAGREAFSCSGIAIPPGTAAAVGTADGFRVRIARAEGGIEVDTVGFRDGLSADFAEVRLGFVSSNSFPDRKPRKGIWLAFAGRIVMKSQGVSLEIFTIIVHSSAVSRIQMEDVCGLGRNATKMRHYKVN